MANLIHFRGFCTPLAKLPLQAFFWQPNFFYGDYFTIIRSPNGDLLKKWAWNTEYNVWPQAAIFKKAEVFFYVFKPNKTAIHCTKKQHSCLFIFH